MTESVILCEGYYDRAYWAGLLAYLGLADPGLKPGFKQRSTVSDIRKEIVSHGQYYYYTPTDNGVRVVPCGSKDKIPERIRIFLLDRETKPIASLIINVDADILQTMDLAGYDVSSYQNNDFTMFQFSTAYNSGEHSVMSAAVRPFMGGGLLAAMAY